MINTSFSVTCDACGAIYNNTSDTVNDILKRAKKDGWLSLYTNISILEMHGIFLKRKNSFTLY